MGTIYAVDLGFDWYGTVDPNTGLRDLQWGVVNISTDPPTLGTLNNLQGGDQIVFVIYDVTQLAHQNGSPAGTTPSIASGWMSWRQADTGSSGAAPFNLGSSELDAASVGAGGTWMSTFFGGQPVPAWRIMSGGGELVATVSSPAGETASFQLTWQITVTSGGTSQTYRVDPEMIVKPGG